MTRNADVLTPLTAKTSEWLDDLCKLLDTDDRRTAYTTMRAVLHALRDRLTTDETAQLAAQLPMLIRGMFYEGWDPHARRPRMHRSAFLEEVLEAARASSVSECERMVRAVLDLLAARVSHGEISDVQHLLPHDIRNLWSHVEPVPGRGSA